MTFEACDFGPFQTLFIVLWAQWDFPTCFGVVMTYTLREVWKAEQRQRECTEWKEELGKPEEEDDEEEDKDHTLSS
jgi:hypothetical protein